MIDWLKRTTNPSNQYRISGNPRYFIKVSPQHIDTSSTLTVTAFTDKNENAIVPCHYRWFKTRNGIIQELSKYKGSSYMCDPSDIGSTIQVQLESNDFEYSGSALIEFNRLRLDAEQRVEVERALRNNSAFMKSRILLGGEQKQCEFKIFEDMIKICHVFSDANYTFEYSISDPRIQTNIRDLSKLEIIFSQKEEAKLQDFLNRLFQRTINLQSCISSRYNKEIRIAVDFHSRRSKDIFILILKGFYTKRQLKHSITIQKLQRSIFRDSETFDYVYYIESLKLDLEKALENNSRNQLQKTQYRQRITHLQRQLQKYAGNQEQKSNSMTQSFSLGPLNQDPIVLQNKNLENENYNLNQRIKQLSCMVDELKMKNSIVGNVDSRVSYTSLSPFMKKSSSRIMIDDSQCDQLLEKLQFSQVKEIPDEFLGITQKLNQVNEQKKQLQTKLLISHQRINYLENQAKTFTRAQLQNNTMKPNIYFTHPGAQPSTPTTHSHLNYFPSDNSGIKFTAANDNSRINFFPVNDNSRIKFTHANDNSGIKFTAGNDHISLGSGPGNLIGLNSPQYMNRLTQQNKELKRVNNNLAGQMEQMKRQAQKSASRIIIMNGSGVKSPTDPFQQNLLRSQNLKLKQQLDSMKMGLQKQKSAKQVLLKEKSQMKHQIQQMKEQLDFENKTKEIQNRSSILFSEMNEYNEEKLQVLKQHNEILTQQNQKLSQACKRYMKEAKESAKLRKQIITLKEKANSNILNPELAQSVIQTY